MFKTLSLPVIREIPRIWTCSDEEIDEIEARDKKAIDNWKKVINDPNFLALEFLDRTDSLIVVSRSFQNDANFRKTVFNTRPNGELEAVMHTDYGPVDSPDHWGVDDLYEELPGVVNRGGTVELLTI